jgi:hypothetical protein
MMKRATLAMCLLVVACVMSTTAQGARNFKEYSVTFKAQPSKGELSADTDGQGCAKGPGNQLKKKGCIRFEVDDFGLITFQVGSQPKPRTCANPGTQWVISKIELSDRGYQLAGGEISNKGIFEDHLPLGSWVKESFPEMTEATGYLYEADPPNTGLTHVTRLNLNDNPDDEPKDIWYRVSVASCEEGSDVVLVTDPRFENDGTSN